MNDILTFRKLETISTKENLRKAGASPIERWYNSLRDTPFNLFSLDDICRAIRQRLYPESIVPHAMLILTNDPLAGDMYDGELMSALASLDASYWLGHVDQATELLRVAKRIQSQGTGLSTLRLNDLMSLLETVVY